MFALQAPLWCFAVFCGLLIMFEYIICVLLVFPDLFIYDSYNTRPGANCCCSITCCGCDKRADHREESTADLGDSNGEEGKPSLIRRIVKGSTRCYVRFDVRWLLCVLVRWLCLLAASASKCNGVASGIPGSLLLQCVCPSDGS